MDLKGMHSNIGNALDAAIRLHGRIAADAAAYEPGCGDAETDGWHAAAVLQRSTLAQLIDSLDVAYELAGALEIALASHPTVKEG